MKRSLTAILALLTAVSVFTACGDSSSASAETDAQNTSPAVSETDAPTEPTNGDLVTAQIGDVDFGGYAFRVVSPDPGKHFYKKAGPDENELFYDAESGDILHDSIYRRNRAVEELLNIVITPVWSGDSLDNTITNMMKKTIMAGDDFCDAAINRLDFHINLSTEHLLLNMYDIATIDLSNPWWDQTIVSNFTIGGDQLYALCGDINYYDDYAVQAIFGNKKLLNDLDIEVPYQAVRDGTWTFDMFTEMAKQGNADLNGDGKISKDDDQIGFSNHGSAVLHMIFAFDERMTTTTADGTIAINYGSEKLFDAVSRIMEFIAADCTVIDGNYTYIDNFIAGRVLFFPDMIGTLTTLRDMNDDFCVLPLPKGDESQKNYTAYVSNGWTTAYAIPTTVSDAKRCGTVLEAMSAYSADYVTPALYDIMLNEKLVRDADSQEMLSYVWGSKAYDLACDLAWAANLRGVYDGMATKKQVDFVSRFEKILPSVEKSLDKFLASFEE
ncbi:MAG: hypothetical protein IKZ09_00510 [Clostridia bacterium]|nr:hypothetical protein [Clostridia bacterium]